MALAAYGFIVDGIVNGFASAMDTFCSQAFGGSQLRELWMFIQPGVVLYLICLPLMSIVLLSGSSTLRMLGQDPEIAAIAGEMLVAYVVAIPFAMAYATAKSALQAQSIGAPFMVASLFAWIVSGASTYLLAYHTSLGIMGIAMSIPISWIVKALVLAPVLLKNRVFVDAWPGWRLKEAFTLIPLISKLGFSSFFMVTSQMIAYICMSLLTGMLPNASVMITANNISASLLNLSALCLTAFCVATATRIGNSLGVGQARRAALLSRVVLFSSLTISLVGMMVMGCVATLYASSFTSDEDATHKASKLIHKLLPLIPWTRVMVGLQGIFRACGKQMLCAQFNFAFLFATEVPLGLLFAVHYDKGLVGLWTGHAVGLFLFVAAGIFWLHRLSWEKMTSDAKRNTSLQVQNDWFCYVSYWYPNGN